MLIKINGRLAYTDRVESVKQIRKGVYEAKTNRNETFMIEGGRNLGGSRSDWFLTGPGFVKHVNCKSVSDAVHVLENM